MCGIAGIITKQRTQEDIAARLISMTECIAHRGPDGEGYLLASAEEERVYFNKSIQKKESDFLALGHRRLAIIDTGATGRQPMCDDSAKYWIVYNGEIYNYIELREELSALGHSFKTKSDTEVILAAYKAWGNSCVQRFNGMWAFCLYDKEKKKCFISRDRLGVKPFYFVSNEKYFAFASEQKAFVKSGLLDAKIAERQLYNYLVNGVTETETNNFFEGVRELFPGHNLEFDLGTGEMTIAKYYSVQITSINEKLSEKELIEQVRERVHAAVKLRMRSDVEVGICLSGGIDSSVIAGFMNKERGKDIFCFTSVFRDQPFNEEEFAELMAKKIHAKHKLVEPNGEEFFRDLDEMLYAQDVPIWDSSTYAQHRVMKLAHENGIKVVLDGQGADELFGGYHHHFVALWKNKMKMEGKLPAIREMKAARKTIESPFVFYAKERLKQGKNTGLGIIKSFLKDEFVNAFEPHNPVKYFDSVNEQLLYDVEVARLKTFLKCEDRCGMWHSVESRTPFSDDVALINFMFSFNGNKKIKDGVSKFLLREAAKGELPEKIYRRYDKRGFETPMKQWLSRHLQEMIKEIESQNWSFVNIEKLRRTDPEKLNELKILFKIFLLGRWRKIFSQKHGGS